MKLYIKIVFVALALTAASNAWGFDGQRKGFVIGGGLGFAPIARWTEEEVLMFDRGLNSLFLQDVSETEAGVGVNLMLGYSWNEYNMIVYEGNASGFKSRSSFGDRVITQGFYGASWYHYYGPKGETFYSVVGVGLYQFDIENSQDFDAGIGGLLGGGYEFSPHWHLSAYISAGETSIGSIDWSHLNLSVLVSAVAF